MSDYEKIKFPYYPVVSDFECKNVYHTDSGILYPKQVEKYEYPQQHQENSSVTPVNSTIGIIIAILILIIIFMATINQFMYGISNFGRPYGGGGYRGYVY